MKKKGPHISPHLLSLMEKTLPIPSDFTLHGGLYIPMSTRPRPSFIEYEEPVLPPEPPYETNMMEALIGWKSWSFINNRLMTRGCDWPFLAPLKAQCSTCAHEAIPTERCFCGIYAAGDRYEAEEYYDEDDIIGQIYGWGRYYRGDSGWRAQLAYPKCFFLRHNQASLLEPLREYRVPIYVEQPVLLYNPEEDGYEYRPEEEDWDSRASTESSPSEEGNSSDEEGTGSGKE